MGDTPRTDAILDLQPNDGFGLEKSQCIAQWYDHSALLERELASLRAECDKWKGQIKEWQAANIQLGQRAERAEHELKDWGELFSAAMCAGIPDRTNLPLLIKEIWPNEWHQECAAVAFLIKEVYERAERAEAELRIQSDANIVLMEKLSTAEAERDAAVRDAGNIAKFGAICFAEHRNEMSELDGGWLHDKALECELIYGKEVTSEMWEGCGSVYCECEVGDTCYFPTDAGKAAIDAARKEAK